MNAEPDAGVASHALDDLLGRYAAGHLPPALHALVAGHLSLRDDNHGFVSVLEASAATVMEEGSPVAIDNRERMLEAITDDAPTGSRGVTHPLLPASVAAHFGQEHPSIPWRFMLPGVRRVGLKRDQHGLDAELLWIRAGRRMPSHTHHGAEYTLVLKGAFSDGLGHYRRGDIAIADHDIDHKPVVTPDEDCICFIVTDAPLKFTGALSDFMRGLIGR